MKSEAKTDIVKVPPASAMTLQTLRRHIQLRHKPRLGFWDRRAHADDHRVRGIQLDHVHDKEDGRSMTNGEWRTDDAAVRAVLADSRGTSPLVSVDALRTHGYVSAERDTADLAERNRIRDEKLIRVAPVPVEQAS